MSDYQTTEEWQQFFDSTFPDGCVVTLLIDDSTEQTAPYDDSPQDLFAGFEVLGVDEGNPTLSFTSLSSSRHFMWEIESVDKRPYGYYAETTKDSLPNMMLSNQLTDSQRQFVQQERF